jgi:hypothetical protein
MKTLKIKLLKQLFFRLFIDNPETVIKNIFNELEKFSWNIECVAKIMDLLQVHLKDILQVIKNVQQLQTVNANNALQLVNKLEDLLLTLTHVSNSKN